MNYTTEKEYSVKELSLLNYGFHMLDRAYSLAELDATDFSKDCYIYKIINTCMVWTGGVSGSFHEMTHDEFIQEERYRIVSIDILDNETICYGYMI